MYCISLSLFTVSAFASEGCASAVGRDNRSHFGVTVTSYSYSSSSFSSSASSSLELVLLLTYAGFCFGQPQASIDYLTSDPASCGILARNR